jgi:hypothetical protein
MTYRNTLIERSRQFESQHEEPVVLDYLQLRNRQCLYAWHLRRAQYPQGAAPQIPRPTANTERPTA